MTEADIFDQTKGAYLQLVHPTRQRDGYGVEIASVVALAASAPENLVAAMLVGASWRERLLGLCLAMAKRPAVFVEPMLDSLREPRGIAIVPACAVLAVLAKRGIAELPPSMAGDFQREAFDGEIGWAIDKALHYAGLRPDDLPGRGPNYGQVFEDHVQLHAWVYDLDR